MKRRILSIITALALCLSLCPTWALAAEADPSLCKHHPEHTEDCGYTAPTEGHDCGHQHTAECYTKGVLPDADGGDPYQVGGDTENLLDCQHSHGSECGYVQADPGTPCGYVCRVCPVEDLIAALPEQVTEDNADDVRAQLDHILDLYRELDEGEQEEIDLSRVTKLQEALDVANAPMQAAGEINISQNSQNKLTEEDGDCPGHTFTGTAQTAMIYVESGAHNVTFSRLNITGAAYVGIAPGATMNLTLEDSNTIKGFECGIYVPKGATLVTTAESAGSLDVSGPYSAGIGGSLYDLNSNDGDIDCGTVIINGGNITATGGSAGYASAGIGGAAGDNTNDGNGGNITINGGKVTAKGGYDGVSNAPGIGGSTSAKSDGTLTISSADVLDGNTTLGAKGTYTITGDPTADMIVVSEDLIYNGKVQELDGKIYIDDSKTGTGTYFGQTFTVNASADGWTYTIDPAVVKAAGDYTVTFSKEGHTSISKTFTVAQSGTQFVGDGEVKTYNGDTLTTSFSAGDTITVKATPTATGAAPQKAAARLRGEPGTGQMALYVGDALVSSEAADADAAGTYTMTVSAADVLLAAGGPGTGITLTARFTANDNMADGAGTVKVNITAAAKAEKDGKVIGYYGESGLDAALANSGNAGATFTLLANVERTTALIIKVSCTLDLNGKTIHSTGQYESALGISSGATVTIRGDGTVTSEHGNGLSVGGTATLEGGNFISGAADYGGVNVRGKLIVTGENVVMRNTGNGNGLSVNSGTGATAQLSAGTYGGGTAAIEIYQGTVTLADLLNQEGASRVAYYKDNTTLVTEGLDGQTLPSGSYTVKECTHAYQYAHTPGTTVHSQTCPACGDAKAAETCSYDAATGRCACSSTLAVTLPADLALTYDGTAKTPAVTVTVDGTELAAEKYQINYGNNINAGNTAKVTVTAANGSFSGSASTTFSISKASLTIKANDQAITYGGNIATGTDQVTPDGLCTGDTLEGVTLSASSVNVPGGTITPSGAVIKRGGEDVTANYNITYQPGALTINKAQAAVTDNPTANTLTYTGAAQALVTAGTASVGEVVYSLTETGTYSTTIPTGTDAGSYTVWYKVEGTTNYEGTALASVDVTIAQATAPAPQTGTLNVQNGQNRDYTYDLSRLLPVLASGQSFGGEVTYTLKTVNITEAGYYESGTAVISGTTLTLPVKAVTSSTEGQIGTITVTISSKNFANVDATINVNRVNKQPVSIEGVTAQNGTYNGESHRGYTGTPTASPYSGGFKVTYAKADGTALSGAPTNAGDYTVTITLNENNDYTGSRTLSFTISKASITIKADDKRADVGTAKPTLTYTVTGLVSGDTLATEPTLACDADMDTIGQYPIIASGAAVPSGGNYNTAITYVPGTLSVTDPTIPVTGVTLNKTSLTLTVGGSERLTATVAPSDATDKSVTWTSSNTAVATVDAGGNITAVSAGTATITVTTADGAKTATCSVTVRSSSGGGSSYVPSTPSDPSTSTITVPVSGDKDTVRVSASVSGTTATVSKIDTTQIENVIGDNGQASMVEIDFTGLGKTIDTVKLPAAAIKDIAEKAQNEEVGGLTVKLPEAEISFDANALSAIQAQAGSQITLTVTPAKPTDLNNRQKEAVGSAPVFDLTLRSSSGAITDFRGGYATVSLPYTLAAGQNPSGVVVYYLDNTGNITPCTTMYDVRSKSAIFTTGHLSLYFVGYDPAAVWVNPFSDVAEGAWYYDAVRFVSENGLMGGYGNGRFGPNDTLTRAQFAQILFNKEGRPVVNYLLQYGDVATGAWYTEAVRWATSQGVVSGYGNGMFGPNDNITREQLAVMLWRYAGSPAATEKELHFTDADKASGYALEALRWAVENGVMGGYGNGQLAPQGLATRAQVAQMLMNFLEK